MLPTDNLRKRCHVNTNKEGDRFVGVTVDNGVASVCFPIGYSLSEEDMEIRHDILQLLGLLASFGKYTAVKGKNDVATSELTDVPVAAYLEIIYGFLNKGSYYTEREPVFKNRDRGKISWSKTIKKVTPIITPAGSSVYTSFIVRHSPPCDKKIITLIHKFCVYESFKKFGWLFTAFMPEKPEIVFNATLFKSVLQKKLSQTNNDADKKLFEAMLEIIAHTGRTATSGAFLFGTDMFEYVWEGLIDRVFGVGVKQKQEYFPQAQWRLRSDNFLPRAFLEPDTIMKLDDNVFVLDAKYYKYGITQKPDDLPATSSIHKQITYGEFIREKYFSHLPFQLVPVYNAFIMPADNSAGPVFQVIGEATGNWKKNGARYERIQGVTLDIKYLIANFKSSPKKMVLELAALIQNTVDGSPISTEMDSVKHG